MQAKRTLLLLLLLLLLLNTPYNSLAVVVRLLAERSATKSTVKLGRFQASYVSSNTEEL